MMRIPIQSIFFLREERSALAKAPKHTMSRALVRRETISGYLFLLPSLIFFLGFVVIPMVYCIILSLTDANMYTEAVGQLRRPEKLRGAVAGCHFPGGTEEHLYYRGGQRAHRMCLLPVGLLGDLQAEGAPAECLPLHLLPACGHRFRGRHRRVEVDVRQLHRHLQLRAEGHRHH